jgi:hypothetical protein
VLGARSIRIQYVGEATGFQVRTYTYGHNAVPSVSVLFDGAPPARPWSTKRDVYKVQALQFLQNGLCTYLSPGLSARLLENMALPIQRGDKDPGQEYYLPNHVRLEMSRRGGGIMQTDLFKKAYKDVTQ